MKVICAWCLNVVRDGPAGHVSHGMCVECSKRFVSERRPETETENRR
jgi:hypothetical protein